jgi:hypothetical protein
VAGDFGSALKTTKQNDPLQQQHQRRLTAKEEEVVKGIEEKSSKAGLEVNIRLVASAKLEARARTMLNHLVSSFSQYNYYEYGNSLTIAASGRKSGTIVRDFIFRRFKPERSSIVNTEEMTSLFHFPLPSSIKSPCGSIKHKPLPAITSWIAMFAKSTDLPTPDLPTI